jgi:hypothetical protein
MRYLTWIAVGITALIAVALVCVLGPKWFDDHHGLVTAIATIVIGVFTFTLWRTADNQLHHTREVERAYLTGGGDIHIDPQGNPIRDSAGRLQFRADVKNNGKTPGTLTHFSVHFDVLANVKATLKTVSPSEVFRDQLAPGQEKPIALVSVTHPNADIVFGAFYYEDIWKKLHHFRFILSIKSYNRTKPDVVGVDKGYWDWT